MSARLAGKVGLAITDGRLSSVFTEEYHRALAELDAAGMTHTRDVLPSVVLRSAPMAEFDRAAEADLGDAYNPFYFGA